MNKNIKEGRNRLQVIDCNQGRSPRSGNPYWRIKCEVVPAGKIGPMNVPFASFSTYFSQNQEWSMDILKTIATVCGAATPLDLLGKRFIADVAINNNFVSLRNPRPYTTEEEPQEPESTGINAPNEWPW